METRENILKMIDTILLDKKNREINIQTFQKIVLENDEYVDKEKEIEAILVELAYDLDFYEQDPVIRTEDASYYGEDRLEQEILDAKTKISNIIDKIKNS